MNKKEIRNFAQRTTMECPNCGSLLGLVSSSDVRANRLVIAEAILDRSLGLVSAEQHEEELQRDPRAIISELLE